MSIHFGTHRSPRRILPCLLTLWFLITSGQAAATLITSASDASLSGALIETFDSYPSAYFASQPFLIGADGFTVTTVADDMQVDDEFCLSFGTSGSCLDTISSGGVANDDFDVVFTGSGVSAFGFNLNALDVDWTIETYDASDNLLGTYDIDLQTSTGFDRRGYVGARESVPIKYFTVRSADSDRALIDNLAFVPVPEPGTFVLAGLGLIGLASIGRRRSELAE